MSAPGVFVVHCSVSMGWLFDAQADDYTEAALQALGAAFAVVPGWWHVEVVNVLLALERRERLTSRKAVAALRLLQSLPIRLHESRHSPFELHALAARYRLTSYDALYLETALAHGLPLATRDKALRAAALASGVGVWKA